MKIEAHSFDITTITIGQLSKETHLEHINLYNGYIKNANSILEKIAEYSQQSDNYNHELNELSRRFSFEYNGIKNHEYYFAQMIGGAKPIPPESHLYTKIVHQWGSWESWITQFTLLAKTRGVGWAILYYDKDRDVLLHSWVDEQHIGHLNTCDFIYGIDLWEHSYVHDYLPSGKARYIADYIAQTNWHIVATRLHPKSS